VAVLGQATVLEDLDALLAELLVGLGVRDAGRPEQHEDCERHAAEQLLLSHVRDLSR